MYYQNFYQRLIKYYDIKKTKLLKTIKLKVTNYLTACSQVLQYLGTHSIKTETKSHPNIQDVIRNWVWKNKFLRT